MSNSRITYPDISGPLESARSDYNAARESRYRRRRTGVSPKGSSADWHFRSEADWLRILEQSRDFDRNDMIVGQTVDRAITNTIQDGMSLDPQTGDAKTDDVLEELWKEWSCSPDLCDISGEMAFCDFEQMVPRAVLVDGDIVVLPTEGGQLQAIEAHRVRTPPKDVTRDNVIHGVRVDSFRKRLSYFITADEIGSGRRLKADDFLPPVDARDSRNNRQVFHIYNPKRFSQTRGISAFAPIFDPVGMFEDIQFASLVKQQVTSAFAIFKTRELGFDSGSGTQTGTREQTTRSDGSTQTVEGIGPGMYVEGQPGEKLEGFSPNIPGDNFFPHTRLILTIIGINLGLPLVLVLMDASETNFSGFRGAVDQARLGFRRNQRSLIRKFHTPVYLWKLRSWIDQNATIAKAAAKLGPAIFRHKWNAPRWPYIEPTKDATGDTIRLNGGLASPRCIHAERGGNWFDSVTETVADYGFAVRAAMKEAGIINQEMKSLGVDDPVAWRELLRWTSAIAINVDAKDETPQKTGGSK